MVACSNYYYFITNWNSYCFWWKFRIGSVYLHIVLNYSLQMKSQKSTETILVLVLFQIVVFFYTQKPVWLYTAFALGLLGLLIPFAADKIHFAWMKLAQMLGYVMSRVLLTLIFFLFLLPLSILSKLFSKNSIIARPKGDSYFKERNFIYTSESLENLW